MILNMGNNISDNDIQNDANTVAKSQESPEFTFLILLVLVLTLIILPAVLIFMQKK